MPDKTLRIVRTTAELERLQPAWDTLWRQDPQATPFQASAWLLPWWRAFGQPDLRVVTILQGNALCGMLPFYIYPDPASGERKLLPLGIGTSDYLDGIFSSVCSAADLEQALELLLSEPGWDSFYATQLRPGSRLGEVLAHAVAARGGSQSAGESCSRGVASAIADLPQKIRRNAMYYRNRALRQGRLELHVATEANWPAAFDALQRLHTERWIQRGEAGVLAAEDVLQWHREALPPLAQSGLLRLCSLCLDGERIGVLYSLIDPPEREQRTQYFYLTAFSTAHAELRPGTLLLAYAIEHAAGEGVKTIDMLRGEEAYKQLWHLERCSTQSFTLHAADAYPAIAH